MLRSHFCLALLLTALLLSLPQGARSAAQLNGLALYSELNQPLFVAAYFSSSLAPEPLVQLQAASDRRLELRIAARRLSARQWGALWVEGIAINNRSADLAREARAIARFTQLPGFTLRRGDRLLIEELADRTRISVNGLSVEEIRTPGLFPLILRAWLGPVPPSTDFRSHLLSGGQLDEALLTRYAQLQPGSDRVGWLTRKLQARQEPDRPAAAVASRATAPSVAGAAATVTPQAEGPASGDSSASTGQPVAARAATEPERATIDTDQTPLPAPKSSQTATTRADTTDTTSPALATEAATPNSAPAPEATTGTRGTATEAEAETEEPLPPPVSGEQLLARKAYFKNLMTEIYGEIRYPASAVRRGQQGQVRFAVTVDRSGELQRLELTEASPHKLLNNAARRAVMAAEPFPPLPDTIEDEQLTFALPIVFRIPD